MIGSGSPGPFDDDIKECQTRKPPALLTDLPNCPCLGNLRPGMRRVKHFNTGIRLIGPKSYATPIYRSAAFSAYSRTMALHKLKVDSLKLKDGELKEVEVEGVENGKVLLASFEGKTQALSSWSKTPLLQS